MRRAIDGTVRVEFDYPTPMNCAGGGEGTTGRISFDLPSGEDHISGVIRRTRTFYEHELLRHLAACGPQGGVYLDVGANIGNHSVFFGKFLADHVVCVEPNPVATAILRRNLDRNRISDATVLECGAGAQQGYGQLALTESDGRNLGGTRIERLAGACIPEGPDGSVCIRTVDDIASSVREQIGDLPVRLVKIDVEGMELDVLQGSSTTLETDRPHLVVELPTRKQYRRAVRFLQPFGYKSVGRFCWTPTYHFVNPAMHSGVQLRSSSGSGLRDRARGVARRALKCVGFLR